MNRCRRPFRRSYCGDLGMSVEAGFVTESAGMTRSMSLGRESGLGP